MIEPGKKYKIIRTDLLFSDWFGLIAECKGEVGGMYEMHANNAFIYCKASDLRSPTYRNPQNRK